MGLLRGFIAFFFTIAVLIFAISNRHDISVYFGPFRHAAELPLYLVALGLMGFGFAAGALVVWFNDAHLRWDRRKQKKRVKNLEKQIEYIRQDHEGSAPPSDFFPALPSVKK